MGKLHSFASDTVHHHVEDYLDRACAPMVDQISYAERSAIREELRAHLCALVEASIELGMEETEAVRSALRQMGKPKRLAKAFGVRKRLPSSFLALAASFCVLAIAIVVSLPRKADKPTELPAPVIQTVALGSVVNTQHQEWVKQKTPCISCHSDNQYLHLAFSSLQPPSSEDARRP